MIRASEGAAVWTTSTRVFIQLAFLLLLLFGFAFRTRIQIASAMPPAQPVLWHLVGVAGDAATGAAAGAVALLLARGVWSAVAAHAAYGAFIALICVLHVVRSEATILFGSVVRAEDFDTGPILITIQRSIRGSSGVLLVGSIVAVAVGLWLASRVSRRATTSPVTVPRLLAVAVIGAIGSIPAWPVHRSDAAKTPLLAAIDLARDARAIAGARSHSTTFRNPVDFREVREMLGPQPRCRFISDDYPLACRSEARAPESPVAPSGVRPNVIFFAMENLRAEEVGAYGSKIPGITPNFDRIASEGIRMARAYSPGTYTPTAELGLWYSLYAVPGRFLLTNDPHIRLTGLPEILRAAGWRSFFWISSTDQTFFKRDRFYDPRGFQMFDGNDFPATDPRVNWGVSDRALARRAVAALSRLPEPFAAMVLTVNNHHPYQLPADAGPRLPLEQRERQGFRVIPGLEQAFGMHTSQMIQTIHYSDQALGDFMAQARQQPWYSRSIFVICGDHGIPIAPLGRQIETLHQVTELRHRVPLVIFSPMLQGGRVIDAPASHVDILPTVLGFARIPVRAAAGVDLLDGPVHPDRPVFAWSEHVRVLTIATSKYMYYCTIPVNWDRRKGPPGAEVLIEVANDPEGRRNLISVRPDETARFRRLAGIYAETYPAVVYSGRSGLP